MTPIDSGRIVRSYTQRIDAAPDTVFLLLCPVRESEWLDGWKDNVEIVHSLSGVAEEGCVFRTRVPGGHETVWMITRHDPAAKVVEFVRVTPGLAATKLAIGVTPAGADASAVRIAYTVTPLSPAGADHVADHWREDRFRDDMAWWQDSMNHWLRHGERLASPEAHA